ncbi:uncharacterized protein JCM6883_001607 [Sporobolomyces salmoneus]|uniref:uncharacterized protein n=1 Tax=Sporobolomyces salmoneus TaxID=183962 RepID=UPI0031749124
MSESNSPVAEPGPATTLEERIDRYSTNVLPSDYEFDPSFSLDENYMVLTLLYARLSMSKRGNMACIIVDHSTTPPSDPAPNRDDAEPSTKRRRTTSPSSSPTRPASSAFPNYPGRILAHSNNFPQPHTVPVEIPVKTGTKGKQAAKPKPGQTNFLIKASQFPEIHAEARSICLAASKGIASGASTAYVSFPPCAACLPLLVAAGIKRLVYRQTLGTSSSIELCKRAGVECTEIVDKELDERLKEKANQWWKDQGEGKEETRTRLERWWAKQEEEIMGESYRARGRAENRE